MTHDVLSLDGRTGSQYSLLSESNIPPVPPADAFEPADNISDNEPDDLPF